MDNKEKVIKKDNLDESTEKSIKADDINYSEHLRHKLKYSITNKNYTTGTCEALQKPCESDNVIVGSTQRFLQSTTQHETSIYQPNTDNVGDLQKIEMKNDHNPLPRKITTSKEASTTINADCVTFSELSNGKKTNEAPKSGQDFKKYPQKFKDNSIDDTENTSFNFPFIKTFESFQYFRPVLQYKNISKHFPTRELGIHATAKFLPSNYNAIMEYKCGRALMESRTGTSLSLRNNTPAEAIIPKLIQLPLKNVAKNQSSVKTQKEAAETTWFQIDLKQFGGVQMGVIEHSSILWSCWEKPAIEVGQDIQGDSLLQFYTYSPIDFHLHIVLSVSTFGNRIRKAQELQYTDPTSNNQQLFNFLIMLNNANQLQSYNIDRNIMSDCLLLQTANPQVNSAFKDFEILFEERQIIVLEKKRLDDLQSIAIFQFPPHWQVLSIITIDKLEIEFSLHNSFCLIVQNFLELTITCWNDFIGNTNQIVPITRKPPNPLLTVTNELQMTKLPPPNSKQIYIELKKPIVQFLNTNPPMVNIDSYNGKVFYNVLPRSNKTICNQPIYYLRGMEGDNYTKIIPFYDNSSRILIRNQRTNYYKVVTFATNTTSSTTPITTTSQNTSYPFDDWTVITPRVNRHLGRTTSTTTRKKSVLGITFSKNLKLFAVLFGHGSKFNVNIYKDSPSNSMCLLKALPIVNRITSQTYTVTSIPSVFMSFTSNLLIVEFKFEQPNNNELTFKEIYFCPLLLEIF